MDKKISPDEGLDEVNRRKVFIFVNLLIAVVFIVAGNNLSIILEWGQKFITILAENWSWETYFTIIGTFLNEYFIAYGTPVGLLALLYMIHTLADEPLTIVKIMSFTIIICIVGVTLLVLGYIVWHLNAM